MGDRWVRMIEGYAEAASDVSSTSCSLSVGFTASPRSWTVVGYSPLGS